eukprot:scaffold302481_cov16-Tisochrysis_lutea.AAC.2
MGATQGSEPHRAPACAKPLTNFTHEGQKHMLGMLCGHKEISRSHEQPFDTIKGGPAAGMMMYSGLLILKFNLFSYVYVLAAAHQQQPLLRLLPPFVLRHDILVLPADVVQREPKCCGDKTCSCEDGLIG